MVLSCGCVDGCMLCVHDSRCPKYNARASKKAALGIFEILLSTPAPPDPDPEEDIEEGGGGGKGKRRGPAVGADEPSQLGRSIGIYRQLAHAAEARERSRKGRAAAAVG